MGDSAEGPNFLLDALEDVFNRRFSHPYPKPDEYYNLCEKCYDKKTAESSGESTDVADTAEPASKGDIRAMLQSARLIIRTLAGLPLDQRIVKLEELLANKPEVASGMEPAYDAYRDVFQKELDNAKAAREHAAFFWVMVPSRQLSLPVTFRQLWYQIKVGNAKCCEQ